MSEMAPLWHVTVTAGGESQDPVHVRESMALLLTERPFMHAIRYADDMVELRYWEEGASVVDVAALAYRLWDEHRDSCRLPDWETLGLEIVAQNIFSEREIPGRPIGQVVPELL